MDGIVTCERRSRPLTRVLRLSMLAKQFEGERTGRRGRLRPSRMGDDGVRDGAVSGRSWIDVEYLLSQTIRYGVGDSACIYEDALVREVGEQAASVSDADRRVQRDRLPHSVDVGFIDAVLPKDRSSQIGALALQPSFGS